MRKHINNVMSIFNSNPSAFILINHIAIGLMMLPGIIIALISGTTAGIPMPNSYGLFQGGGGAISTETAGQIFGIALLLMLFSVVIQSYVMAGYYTYINTKNSDESPYTIFFNGAAAKFGRALGANLLQAVIVFVVALAAGLILGLIFASLIWNAAMSGNIGMVIFFTLLMVIGMLFVIVFFMFMLLEAILTDTPITATIGESFKKVKLVYGPLLGFVILQAIASLLLQYTGLNFYILIILNLYLTMLFNTFVSYPLYMHATELLAGSEGKENPILPEDEKKNLDW
ncbi:MAG: hypothetical protein R2883_05755 [Caldisericia bacterium]